IGKPKAIVAAQKLNLLNPDIQITPYNLQLTTDTALDIVKSYDIIADGSDNFITRYLVNDTCVRLGKPNVYGSILRFEGQVSCYFPFEGGQRDDDLRGAKRRSGHPLGHPINEI